MILFTHSYFLRFDPKQWKMQQPYPPLATIQAGAVLRQAGYDVRLFDPMLAERPEEILPHLDGQRPRYLVIYDDGFNYLTKMCLTNMRHAAFKMARLAHERDVKVIVASSDAADHYEKYLAEGADYVIRGEGEQTLLELIRALEAGESVQYSVFGVQHISKPPLNAEHRTLNTEHSQLEAIPGLAFRKAGGIRLTPARPVMTELDALPMPAWDLVDIEKYRAAWVRKNGYFSLNMVTTRGCPYKCNWCAKPIYGNRYNSRSPQHVVSELKHLLGKYKPQHIWFSDDIFGIKPSWAQEFADLVEKENLRFRFKIQSRVDLLLKGNTLQSLARAGCDTIWVGAESGSQKILDAMDKGTRVEQIEAATREMKRHGIKPAFFLQFGYPGEGEQEIKATLRMLLDLMPDDMGISVSYPLPGTKFYENVKADLKEKSNWTDSDELAMLFPGKYSTAFYKRLHRYVHKRFRRKQGWLALQKALRNPIKLASRDVYRMASLAYYVPGAMVDRVRLGRLKKERS